MSVYRDIYDKIAASQAHLRGQGYMYRLLKVQEEAGEVAQAVIGSAGANKRKGYTHRDEDVAKELADVVITAMVALHDWVPSPERYMKERLQVLTERIRAEGS
jgi:phosphoribosyl-ATP pyrophosphohydrolase